jgi:hypothetical protein
MENSLKFNGMDIKSKTQTNRVIKHGSHSYSMLINGHLIHGVTKEDCQNEFKSNRSKYDDRSPRNSVQYFVNI